MIERGETKKACAAIARAHEAAVGVLCQSCRTYKPADNFRPRKGARRVCKGCSAIIAERRRLNGSAG
jgi:hypothetical protein